MRFICFLFFVLWQINGSAQTTIVGQITDQKSNGLSGATISVTKIRGEAVLSYAISKDNGKYKIIFDSVLDSLQIKVSYLGYSKKEKTIPNKNQSSDFRLKKNSETLEEVVLKVSPIKKKGDTLSYNISYFRNKKDRVIADILEKMPGIEVLADGKILYQGTPIQKYYIEGLDLLGGRYNLANNNLPVNAVKSVEIIEKHQPIKLLDSLVFSDRASLNIKLKNDITTTGSATLGAGASPFLWKVNLTPMLFAKNQQMIASYQTNNIGDNIANELQILTIEDLKSELNNIKNTQNWVDVRQLSPPPFSEKLWLDNNVHLLSVNYLVQLKKKYELKANISYLNNFKQQVGNKQTTILTPTDTVSLVENTNNRLFTNSLQSEFTLTKNTNNLFLKNELNIDASWDSKKGQILLTEETISQKVKTPFVSLQNNLRLIVPIGNLLATINSDMAYTETPQKLTVAPGQFPELFNKGFFYDKTVQKVTLTNFQTDNFIGFTKGFKGFTFQPKIGFQLQQQNLKSKIEPFTESGNDILLGNFQNDLKFNRSEMYAKLKVQYPINSWKFELKAPFKFRTYERADNNIQMQQNITRFTFEPQISVDKKLNAFWEVRLLASTKNKFGDIDRFYYGYILRDYRTLRRYNGPLLELLTNTARFSVDYKNPLESLFASAFYSFNLTNKNLLISNQINENGASVVKMITQDNQMHEHKITLRASKYFNSLNTTLSVKSRFSKSQNEQLINTVLTNVERKNAHFEMGLNTDIASWLNISYENEFSFFNSFIENQSLKKIETQLHALTLNFFFKENQYLGLDTEIYKNNFFSEDQENYFFNLSYRYTIEKEGIDFVLNWNNILNTKYFSTAYSDSFSYMQSTYRLRPSQIVMTIKFTF